MIDASTPVGVFYYTYYAEKQEGFQFSIVYY